MGTAAGIAGPIFISVGDAEKLNKFLELNPHIQRESIFVDGARNPVPAAPDSEDGPSYFPAYDAVGLGKLNIFGDKEKTQEAAKKVSAPNLGGPGAWFKYISNVGKLTDMTPKPTDTGAPEAVLRMGGTFVVDGPNVVYAWEDPLPGVDPEVDSVIATALA